MLKTRFTDLAGVQWPIVQAPMIGGYSDHEMVAVVSNLGCLGTLALGNSSPENIEQQCSKTLSITDKPFAANFFVSEKIRNPSINEKYAAITALQPFYEEIGIDSAFLYQKDLTSPPDLNTQIETIIDLKVPIVTFTFGIPSLTVINKLKQNGVVVIGTATNLTEAIRIQNAGFHAVILQGIGAGGHRASFLNDGSRGPDTQLLNRQTTDSITIPRILAGGIMDGQQIADYLNQGADACQLGSAYLLTDEAKLDDHYAAELQKAGSNTCLSKSFTGKYARVICNKFTTAIKGKTVLNFPFQGQLTMDMRIKAEEIREYGLLPMWAGESASSGQRQTAACLTKKLISELQASISK